VLAGPSRLPDPATHAYRQDLADVALAGQVIASHYAEPLARRIARPTPFLAERSAQSEVIEALDAGADFLMLDNSLGWAWGYAGAGRRVGYVPSDAIAA